MKLKEKYTKEAIPAMMKEFGFKSPMAVPHIEKVVLNSGFGKMIVGKTGDEQKKTQNMISNDITMIAGQKAVLTKAKKAIAGFKTRQGMIVGAKVTLRGERMWSFLERMINVGLPRSRDFQGIDLNHFDKKGNLSMAIKEQIIFPEVSTEQSRNIFSFEVTVVSNSGSKEKGVALLRYMGFPLKNI